MMVVMTISSKENKEWVVITGVERRRNMQSIDPDPPFLSLFISLHPPTYPAKHPRVQELRFVHHRRNPLSWCIDCWNQMMNGAWFRR